MKDKTKVYYSPKVNGLVTYLSTKESVSFSNYVGDSKKISFKKILRVGVRAYGLVYIGDL